MPKRTGKAEKKAALDHVRYVNLRKTLAGDSTYKRDWANELHPTERGFRAVAMKIASAI